MAHKDALKAADKHGERSKNNPSLSQEITPNLVGAVTTIGTNWTHTVGGGARTVGDLG